MKISKGLFSKVFCIMKYSGKIQKKGGIVRPTKKNIKNFASRGTNKKERDEPKEKTNDLIKKIFSGSGKINDEDITFLMNYVEKTRKIKTPLLKY